MCWARLAGPRWGRLEGQQPPCHLAPHLQLHRGDGGELVQASDAPLHDLGCAAGMVVRVDVRIGGKGRCD
jgi:hypothetical protein